MIKVLFFAQLREQLGCNEYNLDINSTVSLQWLKGQLAEQSEEWQACFENDKLLMAINQEIVDASALVNDGDEVAFFPPVTGG
jgi:molybdopterin synthase sulfur carrier subunit